MFKHLKTRIINNDFIHRENKWNITQEHLNALSGSLIISNNLDICGNTVYHYLAFSGNYSMLKILAQHNTHILGTKNKLGIEVLTYIILAEHYDIFIKIVNICNKVDPDEKIFMNNIWLYVAKTGNYKAFKNIIKNYENNIDFILMRYELWSTLICNMCYGSFKKMINDFPMVLKLKDPYQGKTIWHDFAKNGSYKILSKIIKDYPEIVDLKDNDLHTIWYYLYSNKNKNAFNDAISFYKLNVHEIFRKHTMIEKLYESVKDIAMIKVSIPCDFICPISREIIFDPVTTQLGHVYDKQFIRKWLTTNNTDPKTGLVLKHKHLNKSLDTEKNILEYLRNISRHIT